MRFAELHLVVIMATSNLLLIAGWSQRTVRLSTNVRLASVRLAAVAAAAARLDGRGADGQHH
jgi:hypothetical protein